MQSANINDKWLNNIYDNIKRLEEHERLAREGCESLMNYFQIPERTRHLILGDTQFKNLRFFVTEFHLLLSDLSPIVPQEKNRDYREALNKIDKALTNRNLFVMDVYNSSHHLKEVKLKPFFFDTLFFLSNLKVELFYHIKNILYMSKGPEW